MGFKNAIIKFKESYKIQPKELQLMLTPLKNTRIEQHTQAIEQWILTEENLSLLTNVFKRYKIDTNKRLYSYDLFGFLYYAYGLEVSNTHIYNSELLNRLGVYRYEKTRNKPSLKTNVLDKLKELKEIIELSQGEETIYLSELRRFISEYSSKQLNLYLASYLLQNGAIFERVKELFSILLLPTLHNHTKKKLPQPIQTMLIELQE